MTDLTLLPTGEGGGIFIPHHKTVSCHYETLKLWLPNFMISCLYLLATLLQNFSKIGSPGAVAAVIFKTKGHEN